VCWTAELRELVPEAIQPCSSVWHFSSCRKAAPLTTTPPDSEWTRSGTLTYTSVSQAINLDGSSPEAYYLRGEALYKTQNMEKAKKHYQVSVNMTQVEKRWPESSYFQPH